MRLGCQHLISRLLPGLNLFLFHPSTIQALWGWGAILCSVSKLFIGPGHERHYWSPTLKVKNNNSASAQTCICKAVSCFNSVSVHLWTRFLQEFRKWVMAVLMKISQVDRLRNGLVSLFVFIHFSERKLLFRKIRTRDFKK